MLRLFGKDGPVHARQAQRKETFENAQMLREKTEIGVIATQKRGSASVTLPRTFGFSICD
jgi:hypothetical protein